MTHDQESIAQAGEAGLHGVGEAAAPRAAADMRAPQADFSQTEAVATAAMSTGLSLPLSGAIETKVSIEAEPANTLEEIEDTAMLDVHPPHEGIHTWKQFLLHMSTIVLGLLIAVGLEQSVEAIHRARERSELRESLDRDAQRAIDNTQASEQAEIVSIRWHNTREALIGDALAAHRPLIAPLERTPHVKSLQPADPAWNAAKSSGLLSLLTQDEVEVYSLSDSLIAESQASFVDGVNAARKRGQFEFTHSDAKSGMLDLSKATPAELGQYRELLLDEGTAWNQYRVVCEYVRGVETAIHEGERGIDKVQDASQRFYVSTVR